MGICNLSPHLRNSAILRTTKSSAELQTQKSYRTAIADVQNLTSTIPQLSAVSCQLRYFLVPFPQLRLVLKINQKYFFRIVCFSRNQKPALKGQLHKMFSPIFFSWIYLIPWPKICQKLRKWSSQVADLKLRTDTRKNCDCGIAELRLRSNVFLKVAELRSCGCRATFL